MLKVWHICSVIFLYRSRDITKKGVPKFRVISKISRFIERIRKERIWAIRSIDYRQFFCYKIYPLGFLLFIEISSNFQLYKDSTKSNVQRRKRDSLFLEWDEEAMGHWGGHMLQCRNGRVLGFEYGQSAGLSTFWKTRFSR